MRWIVAGGGTGGHFFPALEVAKALIDNGDQVVYIGVRRGIEARIMPSTGIDHHFIDFEGVRGRGIKAFSALAKLLPSLISVFRVFRKFRPDAVFLTGGYVSIPVFLVALILGVPIFIHEQNSIPGLSNVVISGFARKVFVTFEESIRYLRGFKFIVSGNVVREEFFRERYPTKSSFNLLVLGGSLGARSINRALIGILDKLKVLNVRIFHQTGRLDYEEVVKAYKELSYDNAFIFDFHDKPWDLLKSATIVVSRAGSSTITEIVLAGRCAILVPYPYAASNHQFFNASIISKLAPVWILEDKDLDKLFSLLFLYYTDRRRMVKVEDKTRGCFIIGSAKGIVKNMKG